MTRTTISLRWFCLLAYVCLVGLHIASAYESIDQPKGDTKVKARGQVRNQGDSQVTHYENGPADIGVVNSGIELAIAKSKNHVAAVNEGIPDQKKEKSVAQVQEHHKSQAKEGDNVYDGANSQERATSQARGQDVSKPRSKGKTACDPQGGNSTKSQEQMGNIQAVGVGEAKIQTLKQGQNGQNTRQGNISQAKGQGQGQIMNGGQSPNITTPQSPDQVISEVEAAVQQVDSSNNNQAAPAAAAAPPPNNAVVPVAPPPNNAVEPVAPPPNHAVVQGTGSSVSGDNQQLAGGQSANQDSNTQAANMTGANPGLAPNSILFSGIASATNDGTQAATVVVMSAVMPVDTGSSGPGTCNNCQCNCPMGSFPMAQQVAMMAAISASPPHSTLVTITSASLAVANAKTTSQQSSSASISSVLGPQTTSSSTIVPPLGANVSVQQAQANQAPSVASPQAQAVTTGGVAVALPTNLSTFAFQSAVTVALGRR